MNQSACPVYTTAARSVNRTEQDDDPVKYPQQLLVTTNRVNGGR